MNLLLITGESNEEEGEKKFINHYVLIKDFNKFMYDKSKHEHKKHFCMYGLQCFSTEDILKKHTDNCMIINGEQAVKLPNKKLHFEI